MKNKIIIYLIIFTFFISCLSINTSFANEVITDTSTTIQEEITSIETSGEDVSINNNEETSNNISETSTNSSEVITSDSETSDSETSDSETSVSETTTSDSETTAPEIPEPTRILFIGNSATYYNDMPKMVEGMAIAAGKDVEVSSITHSGYKLSEFMDENGIYYDKIITTLRETKFDFVITQDHRELMIQSPLKSEIAFLKLKNLIDENGAKTILYETQADSEGRNFKINGSSVFLDHSMMQYYLTKNYFYIGNKNDVEVSAAGPNYTRCTEMFPEIVLYDEDKLHPTIAGSYLAACTIYESIFDESTYNNAFLPDSEFDPNDILDNLSVEDAIKIQKLCDVRLDLFSYNMEINKTTQGKLETIYTISEGNDCLSNNTSEINYSNEVEYFSLNDSVIAINRKKGTYTALNVGEAMVMAITDDGVMTMCNVVVKQPSTSLEIAKTDIVTLLRNQTHIYKAKILPKDTTDTISWSSDNPKIVSVDENGTITAHRAGVANISATTESGLIVTRKVRVKLATPSKVSVRKLKTKAKSKKHANIKITWKKNKYATKFSVFRKSSKTSSYVRIGYTTTNSFIDKNRRKGRTYYYKIKALNTNTKLNSARSSAKSYYLYK